MASAESAVLRLTSSSCPSLDEIVSVALGESRIVVDGDLKERTAEARRLYLKEAEERPLYGYCTGLGALQGEKAPCGPEYEDRILDEHAAGVGPWAPAWLVRGFLAIWLSQASRGGHPLRPLLIEQVEEALAAGLTPLVPLYGSVGASGDLAPSSHALRCILRGRGEALLGGERLSCREALARVGLSPVDLQVGEALAAINNTAWSTALAGAAVWSGLTLLETGLRVAGYALEAISFNPEEFGLGAQAKLHKSQARVARELEALRPCGRSDRLQDPYSIRCIPHVYGASLEALEWARDLVEREACSPTTNPVIAGGRAWHTCNFNTIYAGLAAEASALALIQMANITLYRIERLLDGRINGVGDFLAAPGSSVGAMIIQYTAASLASEARSLMHSRLAEWIPTSLGHEDANPMSPNAAMRALRVAWILSWLQAIEAVMASLIRARKGLPDPLGVNASLEDPSGSAARARQAIHGDRLLIILDSLGQPRGAAIA